MVNPFTFLTEQEISNLVDERVEMICNGGIKGARLSIYSPQFVGDSLGSRLIDTHDDFYIGTLGAYYLIKEEQYL